MSLWNGFNAIGNSYAQGGAFIDETINLNKYFNSGNYSGTNFVHYFNTTGIMQHNDIGPKYHPTDVRQIKVASYLMQYIKIKFGWIPQRVR